tara:strand:- start:822 stop:1211 length:390 start_codon:yes stop_codon:yes gene_type:complete
MIKDQFNINVFSDDAVFCTSLATECNKYGFNLSFYEDKDIGSDEFIEKSLVSVNIIDLDRQGFDNMKAAKKLRITSNLPIFGVFATFSKSVATRAEKSGFDLVFTKSMLIKSIKRVIIHIADEKQTFKE